VYEKTLQEKLRKGYKPGADAAPMAPNSDPAWIKRKAEQEDGCCVSVGADSRDDFKPMLLNSITDPEPYLKSKEWVMQEKADGVRAIIHITGINAKTVRAYSRVGLPVLVSVECAERIASMFQCCIIDAEVIGEAVVVFDLLSHCGTDLRGYSCADRLRALATKFPIGKARTGIVRMIHTAYTEKEKREMLKALHSDGAEGAVFKQAAANYTAGRPNSGGPALKLKFKASCSVRVIAIGTKGKASVDVALADGRQVASVSTIGRPVPPVGAVVEVEYLYAFRDGGLVQPVYKSIRTDVGPDGPERLQYKGEER
jgi:bifunctional non-homologous end joining protein LigD